MDLEKYPRAKNLPFMQCAPIPFPAYQILDSRFSVSKEFNDVVLAIFDFYGDHASCHIDSG
jgi:hypothetical protein